MKQHKLTSTNSSYLLLLLFAGVGPKLIRPTQDPKPVRPCKRERIFPLILSPYPLLSLPHSPHTKAPRIIQLHKENRTKKEMRLLSANKTLFNPSTTLQSNSKFPSSSPLSANLKTISYKKFSPISASLSSPTTTTIPNIKTPQSLNNWTEFARRVSGEWDGFCAEFTSTGEPIELPENVVPEAYREWEVQVFDWQTQCPTLASETGDPVLSYELIKLLPTVGCEADAATRHSVYERIAGGEDNTVSGLGYNAGGSYVGVWPVGGFGGKRVWEVEHCLVDPRDGEVRVRVVMVAKAGGDRALELAGVRVFSEQWYGPWRNGEEMGGCAVRECGFALSGRVEVGDVVGVWEGGSLSVARFGGEAKVSI